MATKKHGRRGAERCSYTDVEMRIVVEEARSIGVSAAAKKHRIDPSNMSRWLARSRGQRRAPSRESKSMQEPPSRKRTAKKYMPSQIAEAIDYASAHGVKVASEKLRMSPRASGWRSVLTGWARPCLLAE